MNADQRRQAVRLLQERFGVSQRRACRVLGQQRSTQRQPPKKATEEEERLVARMLELVRKHPRYGYRRIWALLRREGWRVNRKRIHRLWRQQGLKVPRKQRKKRRLGSSANSCVRRPAEYNDHVWAWDFLHDRTSDGRPLKWFTLVDKYTRECLALEVGRGMTAQAVRALLAGVVRGRGTPAHIRSDNGPEVIAQGIRAWMSGAGAPWENGYAESFNGKVRTSCSTRRSSAVCWRRRCWRRSGSGTTTMSDLTARWGIGRRRSTGRWFLGPTPLRCAVPRNHL